MQNSIYNDNEYDSNDETNITDDETEYDNICYDPEEKSLTRYNIAICELYNRRIHGNTNDNYVLYHYLIYERYKKLNMKYINYTIKLLKKDHKNLNNFNYTVYRNYKKIINNKNYIKPEITECIYLDTGHCIAIIKTLWIKLIQRKWKKIYKERKICLSYRCNPNALKYREINGKWPSYCLKYPGLKGMLTELSCASS